MVIIYSYLHIYINVFIYLYNLLYIHIFILFWQCHNEAYAAAIALEIKSSHDLPGIVRAGERQSVGHPV